MSTRERIIEEALTFFAENGYDGTGVERIAERVGQANCSHLRHLMICGCGFPNSRHNFENIAGAFS